MTITGLNRFGEPRGEKGLLRVAYVAAGSGTAYCGACFHSAELVRALRQKGVDAVLVPVYLPVEIDTQPLPQSRIFFGGISVFLEQYIPLFRWTPGWLDRLWNSRWMLSLVGRLAQSTSPEKLGPLTLSMLAGEEGYQRKELEGLVWFLRKELRPDVVHLSTALLVGMARVIREELRIPVVANLAGEDSFLEGLPDRYRLEAQKLAATRLAELDALVALSYYYAFRASDYFRLPGEKVWIIPPGVAVPEGQRGGNGHGREKAQRPEISLGYLGRICADKGFPLLVAAACQWARSRWEPPINWLVAGRIEPSFRKEFSQLLEQARRVGAWVEYLGPVDREGKERFFAAIQGLILPSTIPEPKAVTAIEAVARGIPVIAPAHGAFVEIVKQSGCGELYWPNEPDQLCKTLRQWVLGTEHPVELKADRVEQRLSSVTTNCQPGDEAHQGSVTLDGTLAKIPDSARWDSPLCLAEIRSDLTQEPGGQLPGGISPGFQISGEGNLPAFPRLGPSYYRAERMAKQTLALYRLLLSGREGDSPRPA